MIDLSAILSPIEGENPAGENLRYTPIYDAIQEARKEDDPLEQGEWGTEIKVADWGKVAELAVGALEKQTKDLQIAVWLLEALIKTRGYQGLSEGLLVLAGLLETFWDHLYPEIEDDDLDYRIGPLEFMNEKLWLSVKDVPLTDPNAGRCFSWINWQDSIQVGSDADSLDGEKQETREEMIAAGKPTLEEFELAVTKSSKVFYETLAEQLAGCVDAFTRFDSMLDEKFGSQAPRTAEFKNSIEECQRFVAKTLKQKRELEPDPATPDEALDENDSTRVVPSSNSDRTPFAQPAAAATVSGVAGQIVVGMISDTESHESALWDNALVVLKKNGIKKALDVLFSASCSVSSIRAKNRYRLMMAKLCLQSGRPDLARPIAEELNTMVEELGLDRWESPVWIGDVLGALYRCLIHDQQEDEDRRKAQEIFKKMCTIDLTKALQHKQKQS